MTSRNDQLFEQSQKVIPGGVNSPVRAFRSVGGTPASSPGARQPGLGRGRQVLSRLRGLLGPADPGPRRCRRGQGGTDAAALGLSFGAPTEMELVMAEKLAAMLPSMEKLRLVSSGTEATMSAIRLARGFTGRDRS
jgi:glutamate-1-semialdehyde 2,1-aminomutase